MFQYNPLKTPFFPVVVAVVCGLSLLSKINAQETPKAKDQATTSATAPVETDQTKEGVQTEAPKAEAPKAEAPKAEVPKAEVPKAEVPEEKDELTLLREEFQKSAAAYIDESNQYREVNQKLLT